MEIFEFLPMVIDRSTAPESLDKGGARILQNVDVTSLAGRVRRGPGYARAEFAGETTTISNIGVFQRRDGKRILIYSNLNGDLKNDVPTNAQDNAGPSSLWVDVDSFVTPVVPVPDTRKDNILWIQNFDEDQALASNQGPAS